MIEFTGMKIRLISGLFVFFLLINPGILFAQNSGETFLDEEFEELYGDEAPVKPSVQSEEVRARVTEIIWNNESDSSFQVIFTAQKGEEEFVVDTAASLLEGMRYSIDVGDEVYLQVLRDAQTGEVLDVYFADVHRIGSLIWILLAFIVLTLLIGWLRGFAALIGLVVTMLILFLFIVPQILAGANAVFVTVIGAIIILAVNMHLAHGMNKATFFAFLSACAGLLFAYIFGSLFVSFADLSGLAHEESILLFFHSKEVVVPSGVLLAGIILGAAGVLDDIAVTQSEAVAELKRANPGMSRKELFTSAMRIGRHHIASTVNTLVLAYAGVALPLLLLFLMTPEVTFIRFLNEEPIAEEIVRTLAGTMALMLTVPISTWFATFIQKR